LPTVPSTQLYPDVVDASTLLAKPSSPIYLPIGAEGQSDNDGTGIVGTLYTVSTISEARTLFGVASKLTKILETVINYGAFPVIAVASKKGSAPLIAERQAEWDKLASDVNIRIRLSDTVLQADLVKLADSCEDAELVQHKQVGFGGLATASDKTAHITAATAIASSRFCLVGPGVYDQDAALKDGSFAAAVVAAEVAKNADLANDLDMWDLPLLSGIEKAATGLPVFRYKVASGVAINDFEELLQGGVSPIMPSRTGAGAMISHLRTTYTVNTAYDALNTRLIADQVFVDVKNYILDSGFLRRGNTEPVRNALKAATEALLFERITWVSPVTQPDGTLGYKVAVIPSADMRQVTVSYEGRIVRGIQTIQVSGSFVIPV
jgi:hypothetical protein